ncbi:MAG: hypothetical protein ACRCYQ_16575 [Nocardioides sp.]
MSRPVFRTAPDEAIDLVERWIAIPELRALVESHGGRWPAGSLTTVVRQLKAFSSIWDARRGQSRLVFAEAAEARDAKQATAVYQAARSLGLADSVGPTHTTFDHLLILGGLVSGIEARIRHAARLVHERTVSVGSIVGLGSFRTLNERERPAADHHAAGAGFEVDVLEAMMSRVFDRSSVDRTRIGDPFLDPARAERVSRLAGRPPVVVYAASSSDPESRPANTADTYQRFADDEALRKGGTVLVVTSSIYRPFQHFDAVRVLARYGVEVETVGVPGAGSASSMRPVPAYLQEIRSSLRSASRLLAAQPDGPA